MRLPPALRHLQTRLLQSGSAAIGLCGIVLVWSVLFYSLHSVRDAAIADAGSQADNLARTFAEQVSRSIKSIDQSLMFVRESYARDPKNFDVAAWSRSAAAVTDIAIQLSIIDSNGFSRPNAPGIPSVDLRDREHIRFHLDTADDTLFISKPVIGRVSHRWSIQFTRKLFDANGAFDAIAVVSIDPNSFSNLFAAIDLGDGGAVTLFGDDGTVRAAMRSSKPAQYDTAIGKQVAASRRSSRAVRDRIGAVDVDNIRRVTSYREVPSFPLTVAVGIGVDDVLAEYTLMRRSDTIVAAILTLLLTGATVAMLVHQQRHAMAREQLRKSEQLHAEKSMLLETALEHMSQGIIMVDADRRVQVCNRRAMAMLDLPADLLDKGTRFDEILRYQWNHGEFSENKDVPYQDMAAFIRCGGIVDAPQVFERTRPTGEVLEIRSVPIQDGGMVRTYTDITVSKSIEQDLRAAHDQASSATKAKSEFLAMMSHEIRSPMSGLVGALELLNSSGMPAEQAHMAGLAHGSALTLLAILNDILDFSKIEAGALTFSVEPVDVRALITELTAAHALIASAKSVTLTATIGSTVPDYIRTDRLRLGQIITNLLSNAVKFTNWGGITLVAETETDAGSDLLRIDVRDTGLGMDAATQARLFEPFTQADGSSSRVAGGTGLGLCISRRLAQMLDGTLTVVSELGTGSCFTLLMRCVAEHGVTTPAPEPASALDQALAGRRVLVVDDNPTNQWLTQRQLIMMGAEVQAVSNGRSGLEELTRGRFDAVITDCHMPGMDGVAMTARIRGCDRPWSAIPIIGLTADVTPEQARRCRQAGMNEVLYKPVRRDRIAQALGCATQSTTSRGEVDHSPVFDVTTLNDLFEPGDPDADEWLGSFQTSTAAHLSTIYDLVPSDAARPELAALAHRLGGAALSVGALRLGNALLTLEQAAPSQPADELVKIVGRVELEAQLAFEAVASCRRRLLESA